jgi:muramoyltetrapeptide carboxypeptidase
MQKIFPLKLISGDTVQIIAPSGSLGIISQENREIANRRFKEMGLKLTPGKHVEEMDEFNSSSIESRIEDLHDAFHDPEVKAVFSVIGGFNCNQLLKYIDWDLIKKNPKVFCGYSDITALNNAIFAKTGLVNYSGPAYATFGEKSGFDYTLDYFKKCLLSEEPFEIVPSEKWSDDKWYLNQDSRNFFKNEGQLVINEGEAEGIIIGANLCTLNLLQGTEYLPYLKDSVLFLEDDYESNAFTFDRNLQSLIHLPEFRGVRGIVFGRFQKASEITNEKLIKIIKTKKELNGIPIIANADFGHTQPMITFPIGGDVKIIAGKEAVKIEIVKH